MQPWALPSLHFDLAINNFGVQEYMPHVEPAFHVFAVHYRFN